MKKQPPQDTLTEFVDSSDAPVTQMPSSSELAIFSSEDGRVRVETRITDGTVWLSQKLMAQLFGVTVSNITQHLKNIFDDGELSPDTTIKEFLTVVSGRKALSNKILQSRCYYSCGIPGALFCWLHVPRVGYRTSQGIYDQRVYAGRRTAEEPAAG